MLLDVKVYVENILCNVYSMQKVTRVSADFARGDSTGYSKWKMFYTHTHAF